MQNLNHVYVAMSGGVDSAVAAARLLAEGYRVTGIHMETWKDPIFQQALQDLPDPAVLAKTTADFLGIPFVSLDVRERFFKNVVQPFIDQYISGQTPNPCLFCNPQVKWGILQTFAFEQGADFFASGHYARIRRMSNGKVRLLRGKDPSKDQSYVLSMLSQYQLSRSKLPLGEMTKGDVRAQARKLGLPAADRQDSQDLCFLGTIDYRDFLHRFAPDALVLGEIVNMQGQVLGEHLGLALYTIGQRKGIGIASSEPYYVVNKDLAHNRLVIGYASQVENNNLLANQVNWIAGVPPREGETYDVMVRYRTHPVPAIVLSATFDDFRLEFKEQLRGITPGQVAVLFCGEECLGGGVIRKVG